MDAAQIESLRPALAQFTEVFRDCFVRQKTFGYLQTYLQGLMTELPRKSIEPIALAADVPVRTLQEFLADFRWDHQRARTQLQHRLADRPAAAAVLGVLDATGHPKQGTKTPGVHHQYCGESGKQDNCVVAQHLLYCQDHPQNPFAAMLAADLYVPQAWTQDRPRCRQAGIPDTLAFRTKWQIGVAQLEEALGNGIRFDAVVFDADYGRIPAFWFALDRLGLLGVGEVPKDFGAWARPPICHSGRAEHGAHAAADLAAHSPAFYRQDWRPATIKDTTRGPQRWRYKAARVQLVAEPDPLHRGHSRPTDRRYWLIVVDAPRVEDRRYFVSNAPAHASVEQLLRLFGVRAQVEQWFERAKQQAGLGAFEVRTYTGLMRHWLASMLAMLFLAEQAHRLRGEKSGHHGRAGGRGHQRGGLGALAAMAHAVDPDPSLPALPATP